MKTNACVYRSGLIEFYTGKLPDGALPIFNGSTKAQQKRIKVMARLAYDNKTLLVPGIPEAESEDQAYEALKKFQKTLDDVI